MAKLKKTTLQLVLRRISQLGIGTLLFQSYLGVFKTKQVYGGPLKNVCIPGLTCHACPTSWAGCPIGMLQHFAANHTFPFFLIGFLAIIGLISGRFTCGWLCPFGLLQDVMFTFKRIQIRIPKALNYFKYFSLVGVSIVIPFFTYQHWFSKLCPVGGLIAGIPWSVWNPTHPVFESAVVAPESIGTMFWIKMVILGLFLVMFVFIKRPFCRTVCPLGATYALFNRISLVSLKVKDSCTDCGKCAELCPMDLDIQHEINGENCIKCLDCLQCDHVEFEWNFPWKKIQTVQSSDSRPVIPAKPLVVMSDENRENQPAHH